MLTGYTVERGSRQRIKNAIKEWKGFVNAMLRGAILRGRKNRASRAVGEVGGEGTTNM